MKREYLISITRLLPGKSPSSDPISCLSRPFIRLLKTGKQAGNIYFILYRHIDGNYYNFGSLCLTEAKRICFFPGLLARQDLWLLDADWNREHHDFADYYFDHITLETDQRNKHVTLKKKADLSTAVHEFNYPTSNLGDDHLPWFGISVQSPSCFEPTPKRMMVEFPVPSTDAKRRMELILKGQDPKIRRVSLIQKDFSSNKEFLHFGFFISPRNKRIPEEFSFFLLPQNAQLVACSQEDELIQLRSYNFELSGEKKSVKILISKHKGVLKNCPLISL